MRLVSVRIEADHEGRVTPVQVSYADVEKTTDKLIRLGHNYDMSAFEYKIQFHKSEMGKITKEGYVTGVKAWIIDIEHDDLHLQNLVARVRGLLLDEVSDRLNLASQWDRALRGL